MNLKKVYDYRGCGHIIGNYYSDNEKKYYICIIQKKPNLLISSMSTHKVVDIDMSGQPNGLEIEFDYN